MDLRPFRLSAQHETFAGQVLNYQPFIISDDVQTGVAYSWLHVPSVEEVSQQSYPMVLRRSESDPALWDKFVSANARLRVMYDDWTRLLAERYPGGSMLDVACNNGYFLVRAEMFGMGPGLGIDLAPSYAASIGFLNLVCGTHAGFLHAPYDPRTHTAQIDRQFDVVVASNILPHLPDPTHFIGFLGRMAKEAVFLWTAVLDTPELLVSYARPTEMWAPQGPDSSAGFPNNFNRGTYVSRGLLDFAFQSLGFREITYLPHSPKWLPANMKENDAPSDAGKDDKPNRDLRDAAEMVAVLATR